MKFAFPADWTELVPELKQHPDDNIVTKHRLGAFLGADCQRGATQVVLTGVATSSGVELPTNVVVGKRAFPNDYEVKALSPHHRPVIALHSPDRVAETGLGVCLPEKNARKLACGIRRDTFSSAV